MAVNYAGRYGDLAIPFSGTKPGQRVAFVRSPRGLDIPAWPDPAKPVWWRHLLRLFRIVR